MPHHSMPPPIATTHRRLLRLPHLDDTRLASDEQDRDTCRIDERGAHDLDRVEDASLDHVYKMTLACSAAHRELVRAAVAVEERADDDAHFLAHVGQDRARWLRERAADDGHIEVLIGVDRAAARRERGGRVRSPAARRQTREGCPL